MWVPLGSMRICVSWVSEPREPRVGGSSSASCGSKEHNTKHMHPPSNIKEKWNRMMINHQLKRRKSKDNLY